MSSRVYIAAGEAGTGKSGVALGLVAALARTAGRVGVFRPIVGDIDRLDPVLEVLQPHLSPPMDPAIAVGVTYEEVHADKAAALERIVARFEAATADRDVMVIVGSDYSSVPSPAEFAVNAEIAANLSAPVLLVVSGADRGPTQIATAARVAAEEAAAHHARILAVVANRVTGAPDAAREAVAAAGPEAPAYAIPELPLLAAPSVGQLMAAVDGTVLYGDPARLAESCTGFVAAAMTMPHVLDRLIPGGVVITPGDREDVVLGVLLADAATTFPNSSALFLNGGFTLPQQIQRLIEGLAPQLPVIGCPAGTMATLSALAGVQGDLRTDPVRKTAAALELFAEHVDAEDLLARLGATGTGAVTPLMFEQELYSRARSSGAHIVLPEGDDDRILQAAARILARGAARLTLLGDPSRMATRAAELGLDLGSASLLATSEPEPHERYAREYARLRGHKGVTLDVARDRLLDGAYFGTLMVLMGDADGMVSGANHTTAQTIRPALEVVKTVPDVDVVSSVFFMCLTDRVLVYGDCAVNPEPNAAQLADIAISSAATARQFGIEPRVAMLSYSTGSSGSGADVDKVREATALVHARAPALLVEGPIQYDAAVDPAVAAAKLRDSPVAGKATVFVFPDLNTGNNTYKAVQRSANAVAIGPVLQGLRRPVNDLSRGALVRDIVNTIAITAIQAGAAR